MARSASGDHAYLRRAVELARDNLRSGAGGPFGALVVRDGRVLGEGSNQVLKTHDPTAHAEMIALRGACAAVGHFHLDGATLYSSCEPCPMCLAAAHWARIGRIVFAASRDDAAAIGFIDAELYELFKGPTSQSPLKRERLELPEARATMQAWLTSPFNVKY
ncbi:nucleoside deaminase [Fontimonas sp. SYSU GA230001]|uniref:nucleoside deaminase n=1 Tax=Fontimonas sp. SYSU GA230001 TaxID=3142450 RepID=UPI0032B33F70